MKKWLKDLLPSNKMVAEILWIGDVLFGLLNAGVFLALVFSLFSSNVTLAEIKIGPFYYVSEGNQHLEWYHLLIVQGMSLSAWLFVQALHKFYKRVQDGAIFTEQNVKALNLMGTVSFLVVIFLDAYNYTIAKLMLHELPHSGAPIELKYHISWVYLFMALLIFVLASIFKKALKAVKENEETI